MTSLRIGTRNSPLAVAQAERVKYDLLCRRSECSCELARIKTKGDLVLDRAFGEIGTKGIFVRELDDALLSLKIDLAVHSLKDLPSELAPGLCLSSVTGLEDPRDALVSKDGASLTGLPKGAAVGTSSLRRGALLRFHRPDLEVKMLRGNLNTRLRRLDEGRFDAIIVAAAGLLRMGWRDRVTEFLDPFYFVPAVGQGALAVVCREDDTKTRSLVATIDDSAHHQLICVERRFMAALEGGCSVPLGCYGEVQGEVARLVAFLATPDARKSIRAEVKGSRTELEKLGDELEKKVWQEGAREILDQLRSGERK